MPKWVKRWGIASFTGHLNARKYVVSLSVDGKWGCSCPQWKFKRVECKHIQWIKGKENWTDNDVSRLIELTALRVQQLRARGKSERAIDKDLSNIFAEIQQEGEPDVT